MRRFISILIGLVFLAYGLLRLGVSLGLLGVELGVLEIAALGEALGDVGPFLEEKRGQALIPFSVAGYLAYLAVMGLTLTLGSLGSLMGRGFGLPLIGGFLVLWAGLFVNFMTINPKIIHLAVFAGLYGLLIWLKRPARA